MKLAYLIMTIGVGLLFDWVFYSRLVTLICNPAFYGKDTGYVAGLFPRLVVTVLAIGLAFYARTGDSLDVALFALGLALFLGSNLYAVFNFVRHN